MAVINIYSLLIQVFLCFKSISFVSSDNGPGTLVFANVLFRHGDRTPIDPYPNDPYRNESLWPVGFGQLTNIGKEQEFELGQWLRKRYDLLLTDNYSEKLVYVQSTDVDRTLMSAAASLAGMYPPKGAQRWNRWLDWQPIPIHTIPEVLDKVLAVKAPCPAYEKEMEIVLKSKEVEDLNRKFANLYKVLNQYTGKNATKLEDIDYIYDTLYIETLYNLTLPSWTKGIFPQPLEEASKYSFAIPTWTPKLARLKAGLLVKDMISHLKSKRENQKTPHPNVWIYSAHDSTIASLLNTLGVFDLHNPPYSSAVLMELRVDTSGNHQVTLFYRNSTTHEPYLLTLPGCTAVCPLDEFLHLCESVVPEDWDKECQLPSPVIQPHFPYNSLRAIAALMVLIILVLLLVASVILYRQRRKRHTHCQGYSQLFILPWVNNNVNEIKIPGSNHWTLQI